MLRNESTFSPLKFWGFNGAMMICYAALQMLQIFAIIGIGAFLTAPENAVQTTPLAQLGWAFLNLMYGMSVVVIFILIVSVWFFGNLYLLRKEISDLYIHVMKKYSRWDEL